MYKLLKAENLFAGVLVAFLGWTGVNLFKHDSAIASINAQQLEDNRVNQIVYDSIETLPLMQQQLVNMNATLNEMSNQSTAIALKQRQIDHRLFCITAYPNAGSDKYIDNVKSCYGDGPN